MNNFFKNKIVSKYIIYFGFYKLVNNNINLNKKEKNKKQNDIILVH